MKLLHGFFRSGSSHRLRIALDLKGPACETLPSSQAGSSTLLSTP